MIYGWVHVGKIGSWEWVLEDLMAALSASGLLAATEKVFTGYGEGATLSRGENPTLASMWDWAQDNPGHKVWYVHTKGASHPCVTSPGSHQRFWRKYMEYFVVERWQDCVAALDDHDVCGVEWLDSSDHWAVETYGIPMHNGLFAGNFWWANSDFIARIDPQPVKTSDDRYAAEFEFLSTAQPKVKCFHKSYVNLYTAGYGPENYRAL